MRQKFLGALQLPTVPLGISWHIFSASFIFQASALSDSFFHISDKSNFLIGNKLRYLMSQAKNCVRWNLQYSNFIGMTVFYSVIEGVLWQFWKFLSGLWAGDCAQNTACIPSLNGQANALDVEECWVSFLLSVLSFFVQLFWRVWYLQCPM